MTLILSLETSTTVCSAALHNDGQLVSSHVTHEPNSAASQLAVMIDKLLKQSSVKPDAVAVSAGPGSYTGLRIGVATAKGICYASGIPLIAINSLELMAAQVSKSDPAGMLCPMIDARRMEVYTMLFTSTLDVVEPVQARIIDASSYAGILNDHKILFFGNGSGKCKDTIVHPNARFIDNIFPSAEWMGQLAFARFREKKFEDVAGFEPAYLKDFIAKKPKSLV